MKKKFILSFIMVLFVILSSITVYTSTGPTISVVNTAQIVGEEIKVPIKFSNNPGICGITVSVNYNEALVLKSIETGDALKNLVYTEPGNLSSNPINLSFIGTEEDSSNGIIAYLNFEPIETQGIYGISVKCENGDVVDGELQPVDVTVKNGNIIVNSNQDEDGTHSGPIISIGEVNSAPEETVDVPVYISQNSGICGAAIKLLYDSELILKKITRGDALASLAYVKPGNLNNNPINISFIGVEEDFTEGQFFTLTFKSPVNTGKYNISATYDVGDIVDGNLLTINTLIRNGYIEVSEGIVVTIGAESLSLPIATGTEGTIYVAFYTDNHRLITVKAYPTTNAEITVDSESGADYAKVFCWTNDFVPLFEAKQVTLK